MSITWNGSWSNARAGSGSILSDVVEGIMAGFAELADALRRRHDARKAIGTLQGMTDHQLRDIGLHRMEIEAAVQSLACDQARTWRVR
jgi:uncharacterized protein YjiS (DUF1127 family)